MHGVVRNSRSFIALSINFFIDYIKFIKYSSALSANTFEKIEGLITYNYHSLEKGLSMPSVRLKFGRIKVIILFRLIEKYIISGYDVKRSQFVAACSVLKKYYLLHEGEREDISDYFNDEKYRLIKKYALDDIGGSLDFKKETYFMHANSEFDLFSKSRRSIRNFSKEFVPADIINIAVELAGNAPSVCNRQSTRVKLIEDKTSISKILKLQKGIDPMSSGINQLLVISGYRSYFFTSGERSQLFLDGGIFLLNLLYALHFYQIAACPLHWSVNFQSDHKICRLLNLDNAEKVICLVAIGKIPKEFKVAASHRRGSSELLTIY